MRLIGRRRSRRQRVKKQLKELRKSVPASVSLPSMSDLPDLPSMPKKPSLPKVPEVRVPKRLSRDTGGDTPFLSLTGGLLLGLVVGMIVAAILLSRRDEGSTASQRQTGITLLPNQDGDDTNRSRSAISSG
jgi:hypothetical protein